MDGRTDTTDRISSPAANTIGNQTYVVDEPLISCADARGFAK